MEEEEVIPLEPRLWYEASHPSLKAEDVPCHFRLVERDRRPLLVARLQCRKLHQVPCLLRLFACGRLMCKGVRGQPPPPDLRHSGPAVPTGGTLIPLTPSLMQQLPRIAACRIFRPSNADRAPCPLDRSFAAEGVHLSRLLHSHSDSDCPRWFPASSQRRERRYGAGARRRWCRWERCS